MVTANDHMNVLLTKYLARTATVDEEQELMQWIVQQGASDQVMNLLKKQWDELNTIDPQFDAKAGKAVLDKIVDQPAAYQPTIHRVHFLRTAWFRVAVVILIIVGLGTYLWNQHSSSTDDVATKPVPVQNDVLPGSNKATLTLADGSVIMLDSAANGKLTQQAGAVIQKSTNGEIIYSFDKTSLNNNVVYNTMSTPRGGTYQLILPDGSKVWLNAESSITFPTVFNGNRREVKMTGEIYFEVKPVKEKPFVVNTDKEQITVLGTSFNVKAYQQEPGKITLAEGRIKVNQSILRPGKAYMDAKVMNTNVEQDIAWKNGYFSFDHEDIRTAMRQLARWYDLTLQFEGNGQPETITGEMKRTLSLNQALSVLRDLDIKYRLKGKTITVIL